MFSNRVQVEAVIQENRRIRHLTPLPTEKLERAVEILIHYSSYVDEKERFILWDDFCAGYIGLTLFKQRALSNRPKG